MVVIASDVWSACTDFGEHVTSKALETDIRVGLFAKVTTFSTGRFARSISQKVAGDT